jgi:hypothetical protein
MVSGKEKQPQLQNAQSETEAQLGEMRGGERWSLEATMRTYNAGGNENGPVQGDQIDD